VGPTILFAGLPHFGDLHDYYSVIASARGFENSGLTPLEIPNGTTAQVELMLMPEQAAFDFSMARLKALRTTNSQLFQLLSQGVDHAQAQKRYKNLLETRPNSLAGLLNVTAIMANLRLPAADLMAYFKKLIWDDTMQPDRCFAFVDRELINQISLAAEKGMFAPQVGPAFFHVGATRSFKELGKGEASLLLTFYEDDSSVIDGIECVRAEAAIDYYRDIKAHALLEALPNTSAGMIDPKTVYALRWMASRNFGAPKFEPPYAIT